MVDLPGVHALALADLRDEIAWVRRESRRLLLGRLLFGVAITVFFASFVSAGFGAPAIVLTVVFGLLTLDGAVRYRRRRKWLQSLEERLASDLEATPT